MDWDAPFRVYLQVPQKSLNTFIKRYISDGYGYKLSDQIDYENPKRLKGEHFLLQHINSIDGWDNLFYDNILIKDLIGERKIKANELFFDNQLKFETALFGRSSYTN